MFEILRQWCWPEGMVNRIYVLSLLCLFGLSFHPAHNAIAINILDKVVLIIPIISVVIFYMLQYFGLKKQSYYLELSESTFWYVNFFLFTYWATGLNEDPNRNHISKISYIVMLVCYFIENLEYDFRVRKTKYDDIEKEERVKKYYIPKANTMHHFPRTVGEFTLLLLPLLYAPFLIIKFVSSGNKIYLVSSIAILLFPIGTFRLSVHRLEWLFVLFVIIYSFIAAIAYSIGTPTLVIYSLVLFELMYVLFGLSLIYNLNRTKDYIRLVSFLSMILIGNILFNALILFGKNEVYNLFIIAILPLLAALAGSIFSYKVSIKNKHEALLSTNDVAQKLDITLSQTYKLLINGELRGTKVGLNWVVKMEWLEDYLGQLRYK